MTADDEGKSGVNKDTGKIERWNGQAWEILGEQIVVPYETATGTFRAYYNPDGVVKIEGVGTQFTKYNAGDVIRVFDGTNLGTEIEITKIIDDTHATGCFDDSRLRIKDSQAIGLSVVEAGTGIYTVSTTNGLAVGDAIDYQGVYYGDLIVEIIDSTHFRGNTRTANNGFPLVVFKLPRAGSQYKISKSSFSVTDTVTGNTKFSVSNIRTTIENLDTSKIQSRSQVLFDSVNTQRGTNLFSSYLKNNFTSTTQSWFIHNFMDSVRTNTLDKYPASTNDEGVVNRMSGLLCRASIQNFVAASPTNSLTRLVESLVLEGYSIGKSGIIENFTALQIGVNFDSNAQVYRKHAIWSPYDLTSYFGGNIGIGTDPAAGLHLGGGKDLLVNGSYTQLVADPNFESSGAGYTFGTGWAYQSYTDLLGKWSEKWARHTAGNTASLKYPLTLDNAKVYIVRFIVKNVTAGSVKFTMGGSAPQNVANNSFNIYKIQPTSNAAFEIIPTTDFDGAIDNVEIFESSTDEGRAYVFGRIGVNTLSPAAAIDVKGNIIASGTITPSSDERLKTKITALSPVVDKIQSLKGVTYNWVEPKNHGDDATTQIGLIAQDVEKVFPEAVKTNSETGYKSLNYNGLVGVLVEAIKEQQTAIKVLEKRISDLENK